MNTNFSEVYSNNARNYPAGPIPLDSSFYIEPFSLEEKVFPEIDKSGSLLRIKAPREMGKTSLLYRILDYGNQQGYHSICLNLGQADTATLNDINRLLRWICMNIALELNIPPKLDAYWDEEIGSKACCTLYFRTYLLKKITSPLVLVFDDVNILFEYPHVAKDFFPLLRFWFEEAKRLEIWRGLRLVVAHSTDLYVPLDLNQSPFNVGHPIILNGFSIEQVKVLAERYKIFNPETEDIDLLMKLVGGHPSLVHLALYHLSCGDIDINSLVTTASTVNGIYANHLQRHQAILEKQPKLLQILHDLSEQPSINLQPLDIYKLNSLGLVRLLGDKVVLRCELYRQFFANNLKTSIETSLSTQDGDLPQKRKRKRGIILSEQGLDKLLNAKLEMEAKQNEFKRYTLENLSEITELSTDTVKKVLSQEKPVDKQTLKIFFNAFSLSLDSEDFT